MKLRRLIIKLLEWGIHLALLATLVLPFVMWRTFERGFSEWEGQYWFEDELIMVPVMSFTLQWILLTVLEYMGRAFSLLRITTYIAALILCGFAVLMGATFSPDETGYWGAIAASIIFPMVFVLFPLRYK